jgi:hypothetical protein
MTPEALPLTVRQFVADCLPGVDRGQFVSHYEKRSRTVPYYQRVGPTKRAHEGNRHAAASLHTSWNFAICCGQTWAQAQLAATLAEPYSLDIVQTNHAIKISFLVLTGVISQWNSAIFDDV